MTYELDLASSYILLCCITFTFFESSCQCLKIKLRSRLRSLSFSCVSMCTHTLSLSQILGCSWKMDPWGDMGSYSHTSTFTSSWKWLSPFTKDKYPLVCHSSHFSWLHEDIQAYNLWTQWSLKSLPSATRVHNSLTYENISQGNYLLQGTTDSHWMLLSHRMTNSSQFNWDFPPFGLKVPCPRKFLGP